MTINNSLNECHNSTIMISPNKTVCNKNVLNPILNNRDNIISNSIVNFKDDNLCNFPIFGMNNSLSSIKPINKYSTNLENSRFGLSNNNSDNSFVKMNNQQNI